MLSRCAWPHRRPSGSTGRRELRSARPSGRTDLDWCMCREEILPQPGIFRSEGRDYRVPFARLLLWLGHRQFAALLVSTPSKPSLFGTATRPSAVDGRPEFRTGMQPPELTRLSSLTQ